MKAKSPQGIAISLTPAAGVYRFLNWAKSIQFLNRSPDSIEFREVFCKLPVSLRRVAGNKLRDKGIGTP